MRERGAFGAGRFSLIAFSIIFAMPHRPNSFHASPYLLLTLTVLFWSINWVIGRAIAGHVTPFAFTFIRWFVAVVAMMPFAWKELVASWPAIRRHWKTVAWLGIWGTGPYNVFTYMGLQYTTTTNGVMLNSAVPVMIIVLGWLFYRDTITRVQGLGVAVSLLGVLTILARGDPSVIASLSLNKGDLILIVGVVFWAAYTIFLRMKPAGDSRARAGRLAARSWADTRGHRSSSYEMFFMGGHIEWTPATIGAMLYVGVFPSFVAYVFWNRAVAEVGSNVAGIFMHLMPVFGTLLAWIFLDERLHGFPPRGNRIDPGRHHAHDREGAAQCPSRDPSKEAEREMELILWRHAEAEDADGGDDLERVLTRGGIKQADRMAAWLDARIDDDWRILVSPARRTLQTVEPLERAFDVSDAIGTGTSPAALLRATGWPDGQAQRPGGRAPAHAGRGRRGAARRGRRRDVRAQGLDLVVCDPHS